MCYIRDLFVHFVTERSTVYLGDGRPLDVYGSENVQLAWKLPNGTVNQVQLSNVLYILDLNANLVAVMALTKKSLAVSFTGDSCSIRRSDGSLLAVGMKNESLYSLSLANDDRNALLASGRAVALLPIQLWHQRLAHLGYDAVKAIQENFAGMAIRKQDTPVSPCEPCIHGKQHRTPSHLLFERAAQKLALIHTDIGLANIPSFGGSRYWITFTDDFTRVSWVYFLK
jgi:hypothetical protein